MTKGHPRPVEVKAKSKLGTGEGVSCDMWEKSKKSDLLVFDRKAENVPPGDWHEVVFEFNDESGGDLRFHPDPAQAIWVVRGKDKKKLPPCPNKVSVDSLGEFAGHRVSEDGLTLTVVNKNDTEGMLSFRLNFVDKYDTKPNPDIIASHDPGVHNKNGGN